MYGCFVLPVQQCTTTFVFKFFIQHIMTWQPVSWRWKNILWQKGHETFVSGFCLTRRLRPYPFFGRTSQNKKTNKGESWIIYKPRRIEKRVQYIHIWEEKPRPTFPDLDAASSSLFIFSFLFMANWVTLAGFVLQQRPFVIITPPLSVIYLQSCSDDGSNNLAFFPQVVFSWK